MNKLPTDTQIFFFYFIEVINMCDIFFVFISVVLHGLENYYLISDEGAVSSEWTQVVLNYIGPNYGQGIRLHRDGRLTGSDDTSAGGHASQGDGRVVVGREFTDRGENKYGSVAVDELLFFNQTLSQQHILYLKNMV